MASFDKNKVERIEDRGDVVYIRDTKGEAIVTPKHSDIAIECQTILAGRELDKPQDEDVIDSPEPTGDGQVNGTTDQKPEDVDGDTTVEPETAPTSDGDLPGEETLPTEDIINEDGSIEHVVTQADLDLNPEMESEGVQIGDVITLPKPITREEAEALGIDLDKVEADIKADSKKEKDTPKDKKNK